MTPLLLALSYPVAWVISDKKRRRQFLPVWFRRDRKKQGVYYWLVTYYFYTNMSLKFFRKKKLTSKLNIFYTNRVRIQYRMGPEGVRLLRPKRRPTLHLFFLDDRKNIIKGIPVYYMGALAVMYTDIFLKNFMNPSYWAAENVYGWDRAFATKDCGNYTKVYTTFIGPSFIWWKVISDFNNRVLTHKAKLIALKAFFFKKKVNVVSAPLNHKKSLTIQTLVRSGLRLSPEFKFRFSNFFTKKFRFGFRIIWSQIYTYSPILTIHYLILKKTTPSISTFFGDWFFNFVVGTIMTFFASLNIRLLKKKITWNPKTTRLGYFKKIK